MSYAFLAPVPTAVAAADILLGERQGAARWADVGATLEVLGFVAGAWVLFYAPWLLLWAWATRRRSAAESRRIDLRGGCVFTAALGAAGSQFFAPELFHTLPWLEFVLKAGVFFVFPWLALVIARLVISRRPTG